MRTTSSLLQVIARVPYACFVHRAQRINPCPLRVARQAHLRQQSPPDSPTLDVARYAGEKDKVVDGPDHGERQRCVVATCGHAALR